MFDGAIGACGAHGIAAESSVDGSVSCICDNGYSGTFCETAGTPAAIPDCLHSEYSLGSGPHVIDPAGDGQTVEVLCEMESWLVWMFFSCRVWTD